MTMNHRLLLYGAACAAALLALPLSSSSQEKEKKGGEATQSAEMDAMMKKWMEAATPGEPHKKLNDAVGTWQTTMRSWVNGPDAEPTVSKGTAEVKWVLGGRFLQQDMKGEMMGMPFNGLGFTGYDNINKKYVSVWMDNSSTGLYTTEGTMDKEGKVLTTIGKMDDVTTGEHDKSMMYVQRFHSKDRQTFEFHDLSLPEGKTRVGEIEYVRAK
jgi:hypothetical protein